MGCSWMHFMPCGRAGCLVQLLGSRRSQAWKGCRRRGDGECKVTCKRWAQNESCYKRLHLKGSVNQWLPLPWTCRATNEEETGEWKCPLPALQSDTTNARTRACKGTESFPPEVFHFPRQGCNCRRKKKRKKKNKLNFAMLQHMTPKALHWKIIFASDGNLKPQTKFPQWSET